MGMEGRWRSRGSAYGCVRLVEGEEGEANGGGKGRMKGMESLWIWVCVWVWLVGCNGSIDTDEEEPVVADK